jgi:hypothetical protein
MDYLDYDLTIRGDLTVTASANGNDAKGRLQLDKEDKRIIEYGITLFGDDERIIDKDWIKDLGTKLADALLAGDIRSHFYAVKSQASDKGLRIHLRIESSELSEYPWEALYENGRYIATSIETPLTRFIPLPKDNLNRKMFSKPLKILVIGSNPSVADFQGVEIEREIYLIQNALERNLMDHNIELDIERDATVSNILHRFRQEQYNIIHFIGHGIFKDNTGYLALVNENDGGMDIADHRRIGQILQNQNSLGVIVLSAAQGAEFSTSRAFTRLAPELIRVVGIPSVIAMRYRITNRMAHLFSKEFYNNLHRMPIDETVQRLRQTILVDSTSDPRDFVVPILFMSIRDGMIFRPAEDEGTQRLTERPALRDKIEGLKRAYEKLVRADPDIDVKDFWLLIRDMYLNYTNELGKKVADMVQQMTVEIPILLTTRDRGMQIGDMEGVIKNEQIIRFRFLRFMGNLELERGNG